MDLGGLSLVELIRRTIRESWHDAVFGQGGRMAFYHFLAIFPAMLVLRVGAGHWIVASPAMRQTLVGASAHILPVDVMDIVRGVARDFGRVHLSNWRVLTTAAGAIWAACNGTWAMIYGLNTAYEVDETRSWRELAATIVGLTAALSVISGIALVIVGGSALLRSHTQMHVPLGAIQSLVLVAVLLFWFAILYRFAPCIPKKRWQWSTPGALTAAALWLAVTLSARIYFERIDNYRVAYGRLSGVAMLLLWLYLTNGAILIGGEMNSEIEKAAGAKG